MACGRTLTVVLLCLFCAVSALAEPQLYFGNSGYTNFGEWHTYAWVGPLAWQPGGLVELRATLIVLESHLSGLAAAGIKADGFCLLVTAERTFDAQGWLRLASDERMSTLLTPAGLAITGSPASPRSKTWCT